MKASERKVKAAEKDCCRELRERQLHQIREYYASFPVIRDMWCPACNQKVEIRVYERPEA